MRFRMEPTREQLQEFEKTCQRINARKAALINADRQLERDVMVSRMMEAWTKVVDLTKLEITTRISPDAKKALLIARTALELAIDEVQLPPVKVERISTDYVEYLRGRLDPRD